MTSFLAPVLDGLGARLNDPVLYILLEGRGEVPVTGGELLRQVEGWRKAYASRGVGEGDVTLIGLDHGTEIVPAFLGAVAVGALPAVLPYPTLRTEPGVLAQRIADQAAAAGARAVVTKTALLEAHATTAAEGTLWLSPGRETAASEGDRPEAVSLAGDAPAYIQYSSGTTGHQKGVLIGHHAVLRHAEEYGGVLRLQAGEVVVSWLPLFHDMGLVTSVLMPLLCGLQAVLISPYDWVRRPSLLFQMVARYRGNYTWMPNFAFNLCVQRVRDADLQDVDLGSLVRITNGAEMARLRSVEAFNDRFAAFGLGPDVVGIGYGMAETTLAIAVTPRGRGAESDWIETASFQLGRAIRSAPAAVGSTSVMSCGRPISGTRLRVVGEEGQDLPPRQIGEVLVQNEHLFLGYHRREDLTREALLDGWLHTGDLGYHEDGELYLCGRKKDLIIASGRNVYPEEVEEIIAQVDGLRPGRAVAFAVEDERAGTEGVVIVAELDPRAADSAHQVESAIRLNLVQRLDLVPLDVRLVPRGWVEKTTSGKVGRAMNRDKYLNEFGPWA
jgi:acyl-CoA synthetase (AMP-forming)/AMP-acid ligase II